MIQVQPPKTRILLTPTDEIKFTTSNFIKFYTFLQILFSIDFGVFNFKTTKLRFLVKSLMLIYSLNITISSVVLAWLHSDTYAMSWFFYYTSEYWAFFLIFNWKKNQLFNCLREMGNIDSKLNVNSNTYNLEGKFMTIVLLNLLIKIGVWLGFCFYGTAPCLKPLWVMIVHFFIITLHDILLMTNSYAFYSMYRRLVTFKSKLEHDSYGLVFYHGIYKSLADAAENIKGCFETLIAVTILYSVPDAMFTIYHSLQNQAFLTSVTMHVQYMLLSLNLVLIIAPAFLAGKWTSQAEEIKLILHNKWLQEQDPSQAKRIVSFIDYVEARPLIFYVYEVIPLSMDLLGIILNFCVTYLIVIIQFAHLY